MFMKPSQSIQVRESERPTITPKKKRSLDNSMLKPFFGKSPKDIWEKDIRTGEGNFSF